MAKITITFQEEGKSPATLEIPSQIGDILDKHVSDLNLEGNVISGKTELFMKMTWNNWLKPILNRQGISVESFISPSTLQQLQTLETQLLALKKTAEQEAMSAIMKLI